MLKAIGKIPKHDIELLYPFSNLDYNQILLKWTSEIGAIIYGGMAVSIHLKNRYNMDIYDNQLIDIDCYLPFNKRDEIIESLTKLIPNVVFPSKITLNIVHPTLNDAVLMDIKLLPTHIFETTEIEIVDGQKLLTFNQCVSMYFSLINGYNLEKEFRRLEKDFKKITKIMDILVKNNVIKQYDLKEKCIDNKREMIEKDLNIHLYKHCYLCGKRALERMSDKKYDDNIIDIAVFKKLIKILHKYEKEGYSNYELIIGPSWIRIPSYYILYNVDKSKPKIRLYDCTTIECGINDDMLSLIGIASYNPDVVIDTMEILYNTRNMKYIFGEERAGLNISGAIFLKIENDTGFDRYDYSTNIEYLEVATKILSIS
jgi:hypothetical protein